MASITSKSHLIKNSFSIENLLAKPHFNNNKHETLEDDNFKLTQENIQKFNDFQNNNNIVMKNNPTESICAETISVKSSNKVFSNTMKKMDYDKNRLKKNMHEENQIFEHRIYYENGNMNVDDLTNGLRTPDSSFTDENIDTSSENGSKFNKLYSFQ